MAAGEQRNDRAGDIRRVLQGINRRRHRIVQPGLPQIAIPRPQPVGLPRAQRRRSDQAVEGIVLGRAIEHVGNCRLDCCGALKQRGGLQPGGGRQHKIVDRAQLAAVKFGWHIFNHPEPEILQCRNRIRQRQRTGPLIELEPQYAGLVPSDQMQARIAQRAFFALTRNAAQPGDVDRGFGGAIGGTIGQRERLGIAAGHSGGARGIVAGREFGFDRIAPAAQHRLQPGIECSFIRQGRDFGQIKHEPDQGQIAVDRSAPVEQRCTRRLDQHRGDLQPGFGRHDITRHPYERKQVPFERRADQRQFGPGTVGQAHCRSGDPFNLGIAKADHQIVRQLGQHMGEGLSGMAMRRKTEPLRKISQVRAQPRDLRWRGRQCGAGPDAGMDR